MGKFIDGIFKVVKMTLGWMSYPVMVRIDGRTGLGKLCF